MKYKIIYEPRMNQVGYDGKRLKVCFYKWGFWVRVFGSGFSAGKGPVFFSERYRYEKVIRFGSWRVKWLKRDKA